MDQTAISLLLLVFGSLGLVGIAIMVIRLMSMPVMVALVVGITGWLAFFYALGLDKAP